MQQRGRTQISSGRERVPAVIYANEDFSVWRKVKGAQIISVVALLFWGVLFLAFFV